LKTKYLHIVFSEHIQSYDIPKFRAAVIEKSLRRSDLFHNHSDGDNVVYRYPLIQYKVHQKKASLVCLNEATEDIHYLLSQKNFDFRIGKEVKHYEIDDVRLKYEYVQTHDTMQSYSLLNWMGLNQDNFKLYQNIESYIDKIKFLEDLLYKHLLIFMEAMKVVPLLPLKLNILSVKGEKFIEYKNIFHLTFTLHFNTNLYIPDYVGLGKGVSVGFGIIRAIIENNKK